MAPNDHMIQIACGITSANMQGLQNRRRLFQDEWRARDGGRPEERLRDRRSSYIHKYADKRESDRRQLQDGPA